MSTVTTMNPSDMARTAEEYQAQRLRRDRFFLEQDDDGPKMTIWNQVDGTPMVVDRYQANTFYLKMDVARCSVCAYTSGRNADVRNHIQRTAEDAERHRDAKLVEVTIANEPRLKCSACGSNYRSNKGRHHIDTALRFGPLHQHAEVRRILLYGVAPPVLEEPETVPTGVVATQERSRRRRHRRRGRGGKGA